MKVGVSISGTNRFDTFLWLSLIQPRLLDAASRLILQYRSYDQPETRPPVAAGLVPKTCKFLSHLHAKPDTDLRRLLRTATWATDRAARSSSTADVSRIRRGTCTHLPRATTTTAEATLLPAAPCRPTVIPAAMIAPGVRLRPSRRLSLHLTSHRSHRINAVSKLSAAAATEVRMSWQPSHRGTRRDLYDFFLLLLLLSS
ncbi:hypothetical protein V1507DRAFT_111125 [Lipomyces tetrasporus]